MKDSASEVNLEELKQLLRTKTKTKALYSIATGAVLVITMGGQASAVKPPSSSEVRHYRMEPKVVLAAEIEQEKIKQPSINYWDNWGNNNSGGTWSDFKDSPPPQ